MLVLAAIALVGLLGCAAMSVDVGWMMMAASHCQAVADAAALAAAGGGAILGQTASVVGRAQEILDANGVPALPARIEASELIFYGNDQVVPGYGQIGPNDEAVTVPVHVTATYRFGRALGLSATDIRREATALRMIADLGGMGVLFAIDTSAGETGIDMTGQDATIDGPTHSNTKVRIGGNGNRFTGVVEYRNKLAITGNNHILNQGSRATEIMPDPAGWTPATFAPYDYEIWGDYSCPASGTVPPGCYRVHGNVHVSGSNQVVDKVTFVADGYISFSGSNQFYTPNRLNVFAFSLSTSDNGAISVSGAKPGCFGTLYAPNGNATFSGSNMIITRSSVIGKTVDVSGNQFTLRPTPAINMAGATCRLIK